MKSVVVFAGKNGVDFSEVRTSVLRIPEVSIKIRQAQKAIDQMGLEQIDLLAIANSEDSVLNNHSSVKTILSSLVQLALFERSLKSQRKPSYLLAAINEPGVLDLIKGETIASFVQRALETEAEQNSVEMEAVTHEEVQATGSLIGLAAEAAPLNDNVIQFKEEENFAVLEVNINELGTVKAITEVMKASEPKKLFVELIEKMNVTKFVNIGPSSALASSNDETLESVTVIDSIEADPILNWFWQGLRQTTAYAV